MSVFYPIIGALEAPTSLLLTTTNVTDVFAMVAPRTDIVTIIGIVITNTDASPISVSIWWTENTTDHLIFIGDVPAGETITEALKTPIRLNATVATRKIRAQAATGNMITVSVFSISVNVQANH